MPVIIKCPKCQAKLRAPQAATTVILRCTKCGQVMGLGAKASETSLPLPRGSAETALPGASAAIDTKSDLPVLGDGDASLASLVEDENAPSRPLRRTQPHAVTPPGRSQTFDVVEERPHTRKPSDWKTWNLGGVEINPVKLGLAVGIFVAIVVGVVVVVQAFAMFGKG